MTLFFSTYFNSDDSNRKSSSFSFHTDTFQDIRMYVQTATARTDWKLVPEGLICFMLYSEIKMDYCKHTSRIWYSITSPNVLLPGSFRLAACCWTASLPPQPDLLCDVCPLLIAFLSCTFSYCVLEEWSKLNHFLPPDWLIYGSIIG